MAPLLLYLCDCQLSIHSISYKFMVCPSFRDPSISSVAVRNTMVIAGMSRLF